jgi:probable addiction module antidote protein
MSMKADKSPLSSLPDDLDNPHKVVEYLNACMGQQDDDLVLAAILEVARAQGVTKVANAAGLGRANLYKSLTPGAKPRYETIQKLLHAIGVKFVAVSE